MRFEMFCCDAALDPIIECYWLAESNNSTPIVQKIIPDGFPEIIYHYGNLYQIKLYEKWQLQKRFLFSGQIKRFFHLQNTGPMAMVGIKLKPYAPALLFQLSMEQYSDKVIGIDHFVTPELSSLQSLLKQEESCDSAISKLDNFFLELLKEKANSSTDVSKRAVELIFKNKGNIPVERIAEITGISRRQLERQFLKNIGLSPKYYARIIRFNQIFDLMKEGDPSWCELAIDSGYYDQAHFIKDFKTFSGEHPSTYGFTENTFANFFLNKNG